MLAISRNLMLLVCALFVVACSRFGDARIVGTWRCEIEDWIEEITFNGDHSFQSLLTFKDVFTTPSPIEKTGTWRTKGNQIQLEAIVTWNKERKKEEKTLIGATRDEL